MDYEDARDRLMFHAQSPDARYVGDRPGFLAMLRPYRGLNEGNFREILECLEAVAESLRGNSVDRELMNSLWGICHFGRAWGAEGAGQAVPAEDSATIAGWIDAISYLVASLLDGQDYEDAVGDLGL